MKLDVVINEFTEIKSTTVSILVECAMQQYHLFSPLSNANANLTALLIVAFSLTSNFGWIKRKSEEKQKLFYLLNT